MPTTQSERDTLGRIADDFQSRGFQVVLRPDVDQRPGFLKEFEPDLLALSAQKNFVIDVCDQTASSRIRKSGQMKTLVGDQPGWQYHCYVAPRPPTNGLEGRKSLTPAQIGATLKQAEKLAESREFSAAFLLAWAALEAVFRQCAEDADVLPASPFGIALLKAADSSGAFDEDEDYERMVKALEKREALAHGFAAGRVTQADVKRICAFARQLA